MIGRFVGIFSNPTEANSLAIRMSAPATIHKNQLHNIKRVGLRWIGEDSHKPPNHYSSKDEHAEVWSLVQAAAPPPPPPAHHDDQLRLGIVEQVQSANDPDHWSLFLSGEDHHEGTVYQANGDAFPGMTYNTRDKVKITTSASFKNYTPICPIEHSKQGEIGQILKDVHVPKAAKHHADLPNCQDWVCWGLDALEKHKVIPSGSEEKGLKLLKRPLRKNQ